MSKGDNRRPGKVVVSCDKGHAMLDQKGRCIRCGDQVEAVCGNCGERTPVNEQFVGSAHSCRSITRRHVSIDGLAIR